MHYSISLFVFTKGGKGFIVVEVVTKGIFLPTFNLIRSKKSSGRLEEHAVQTDAELFTLMD